jgi:hypothetical protein
VTDKRRLRRSVECSSLMKFQIDFMERILAKEHDLAGSKPVGP